MQRQDVAGKVVIVTGAGQGLGEAISHTLGAAGARVCACDIKGEQVRNVAEEISEAGGTAQPYELDVRDAEQVGQMVDSVMAEHGRIDVLINNAGTDTTLPLEELSIEDWNRVLDVNLTAVFMLCQMAARQFMEQGEGGKIITVSSMLSFFGGFTVPAYAASKGGVAQLTKALCNEWAGKGITVNSLAPGYMATDMNEALLDPENPRNAEITGRIPAGRWGTGEDMKGPVIFLASRASDYLNGAVIPVDGGYLVR